MFITEGQSAKAFASAGIATVSGGHNRYGAFAIKGKFINATGHSLRQVFGNTEVQALVQILGLDREADYTVAPARRRLRYGHVCFLTDADGRRDPYSWAPHLFFSGLLFPSLWRAPGFFSAMSTPVAEVLIPGQVPRYFYTSPDYVSWQDEYRGGSKARVQYIKGLGTMSPRQAKREFAAPRYITYTSDGTAAEDEALALGFSNQRTHKRKTWLLEEVERRRGGAVRASQFTGNMSLKTFVNDHAVIYHCTALSRALPSLLDGLKESQRKVLFGSFLKGLTRPMKLDQLAGFISERAGYHHGGQSLQDTMIKMAQGFVGSNNVPLLQNAGQFGSRAQGGDDAAAGRYLFTAPEAVARALFPVADDPILTFRMEDGTPAEPGDVRAGPSAAAHQRSAWHCFWLFHRNSCVQSVGPLCLGEGLARRPLPAAARSLVPRVPGNDRTSR